MKKRCVLDIESRSEAPLKLVGVSQYARHKSTEIICISYKIGKSKTKLWWPILGEPIPEDLAEALDDEDTILVAHNVPFEWSMFEFCLPKYDPKLRIPHLPIERWKCTAAKAASHALPRKLEKAASALGLPIQKDMGGHKIMMKMNKPRPTWVKKGTGDKYNWKKEEVKKLGEYCITDTDLEALLDDALPDLTPYETQVWYMDHRMNTGGVTIDLPTVKIILRLMKEQSKILHTEFRDLTNDKVQSPAQVQETLALLNDELGCYLPDMKAATVKEALLDEDLDEMARRILELRQMLSKSSTAKFKALLLRTNRIDLKLRDLLLYWGASTGRFSGQGFQIHNLPSKVKVKNSALAIEIINQGDLKFLTMLYRDVMEVFSSVIRGMITASPGKELFVGDFAAIEARVLFWIAEYEAGLKMFRDGKDLYREEASSIYNTMVKNITLEQRQLGKVAILGLGYGMGESKFYDTAIDWGVKTVTPEIASKAVKTYRKKHKEIPKMWAAIEKAAIAATLNPGREYKLHKVTWSFNEDTNFLYCKLPSGRSLAFYGPEVKKGKTPWGDVRPVLYHWSVNPKTKNWQFNKTYGGKLVENICQAIARDLMVHSMFEIESEGYHILTSVHDEVVSEMDIGKGNIKEFEKIMARLPKWGKGCPLAVEAWKGPRYRK